MPERRAFHQEVDEIRHDIVRLAAMVTECIPRGTEVLLAMDLQGAQAIIEGDDELDTLALDIEEHCYQVLALQQPMASDLRAIVTALRLTSEIERSGDLMVNICKGARRIYGAEFDPKVRGLIERMSEEATRLFRLAIDAYAEGNAALAAALDDMDDRLDTLHKDYIQAIFESHRAEGLDLQAGVQLALIGRYYERIGDHAVNIGNRVQYMVTGWLPEHSGQARVQARQRRAQIDPVVTDDLADSVANDPGLVPVADEPAASALHLAPPPKPDPVADTALVAMVEPDALVVVGALAVFGLAAALSLQAVAHRRLTERLGRVAVQVDPDRVAVPASGSGDDASLTRIERSVDRLLDRERSDLDARLRLDRALAAIPEGVIVTDQGGTVVLRNPVADRFADGRHGDALVGAAIDELVAGVLADGQAATRTLDLFGPPRRALVIDVAPLVGEGRAVGALALIADVTERRRLEAVRRDFVANISHELKTPVGALSLLAETMIGETDPAVGRRLAERMMNEAIRVAHTIEDLIQLSRIEVEEAPVREPVSVAQVVAEAVTRLAPAAEHAGLVLDVREPDARLTLLGDRRQLVSAISNLLDNAVKYSDPGSVIDVRTGTDGQSAWISVGDHGIGIPARDLERVFERFYHVDHARSRQTGGTGLGLAIVRHVVNNHQGEIEVDSRMGEGSTFTLRFPSLSGPIAVSEPEEHSRAS